MGKQQKTLLSNFVERDQIAKELGKHPRTVDRWLERGYIVGCKLGGLNLIDVEASRARLASLCNRKTRLPRVKVA